MQFMHRKQKMKLFTGFDHVSDKCGIIPYVFWSQLMHFAIDRRDDLQKIDVNSDLLSTNIALSRWNLILYFFFAMIARADSQDRN